MQQLYVCEHCGMAFATASQLYSHRRAHTLPFSCERCCRKFQFRLSLREHLLRCGTGVDQPYTCSDCGSRFTRKQNLVQHCKYHRDGALVCPQADCGRTFKHAKNLLAHVRQQHTPGAGRDDPQNRCSKCCKQFQNAAGLRAHARSHACNMMWQNRQAIPGKEGERTAAKSAQGPYECDVCGRRFGYQAHLARHAFVHRPKVDLIRCRCLECGKCFPHERYLRLHEAVHRGRQFTCPVCGRRFLRSGTLKNHMAIIHCDYNENLAWRQDGCGVTFDGILTSLLSKSDT